MSPATSSAGAAPSSEGALEAPNVPVRMLNELAYCPRLFALEWLHDEWADNHHTVRGRAAHARVDAPTRRGLVPADPPDGTEEKDEGPAAPAAVRSVSLSDDALGMVSRIDLVEQDGQRVVPIEYKKGLAPDVPEGAWEPERVQVCAQGLLLRAHGYACTEGAIWFHGSRRRVPVPFTDALIERTLGLRDQARAFALAHAHDAASPLPRPLDDSPKCRGCSLVGICLPDEVSVLTGRRTDEVRPLVPGRDDGVPLYVVLQGGSLGKRGGEIVIRERREEVARARIAGTSQVVVLGNASVSTALVGALAEEDVPLALHSRGGWYRGSFMPASGVGALLRIAQHRAAESPTRRVQLARAVVASKIMNQRVLLRRNGRPAPKPALQAMRDARDLAQEARGLDALRGAEGLAARHYFSAFDTMVRAELKPTFAMNGRNRRPPRDPINALLSFAYACLVREITQVLRRVGFDAERGFLHQPRHGRPALALDLMEEFRPVLADSVVLNAINNGVVQQDGFQVHPTGVALSGPAKKGFIRVWERRLDELATHPLTGSRLSMRRMLELHARLWARHLHGELPDPPTYSIR